MKLLKNIFFSLSFLFIASVVYAEKTHAAIDISLGDNKEEKTISVIVNSNGSYLPGIAINVKHSDDVKIVTSVNTKDYCKFHSSNEISEGMISILCLNESDTVVNGTVAVISYEATNSGYSFNIDKKSLDIGSLPLGEVKDINWQKVTTTSESTDIIDTTTTTTTTNSTTENKVETNSKVTDFLRKNRLYVLAGSITLIAIIIAIIGFTPRKKESN